MVYNNLLLSWVCLRLFWGQTLNGPSSSELVTHRLVTVPLIHLREVKENSNNMRAVPQYYLNSTMSL